MNRRELVEKINSLDVLSPEEKTALVDLLKQKKYGLVWEDKPEDVEERLRAELPVLREVKDKALTKGGEDAPNHILIEGDNLEALTALTYTHENSIDVIYIDPPYNTGNKDFVYNDSFVDSEDGYRHSKWLSFMNKRLRIAKRLLSDKGVIFISIDDNEQANLKLLCDEVFGNNNFCGDFIWRKKSGGGQTDTYFVTEHEYILVYQKSNNFHWIDPTERLSADSFSFKDENGAYNRVKLEKWGSAAHKEDRPSMYFPLKTPSGDDYYPIAPDGKAGRWRVGLPRMESLIANGLIEWKNNRPYEKVYFDEKNSKEKVFKSRSILYSIAETGDGTRLLNDILLEKDVFDNPKPIELVKEFISHNVASTILDFFAGSGTTLHATMQLNAEDGGHRQCILVTNNENNICEEVTYERNKRVINGYTTPKGEQVEGLHNNNLRYYQIDHVEREASLTAKRKLMNASAELLCIKHDIYEEQTTFGSLTLKPHIARFFAEDTSLRQAQDKLSSAQAKQMLIIYKVEAIEQLVEEIKAFSNIPPNGGLGGSSLLVYVFSTNNYAMDADFEDVADKVTLCALPAAIYNAYLKVLPKKGEPKLIVAEEEGE